MLVTLGTYFALWMATREVNPREIGTPDENTCWLLPLGAKLAHVRMEKKSLLRFDELANAGSLEYARRTRVF